MTAFRVTRANWPMKESHDWFSDEADDMSSFHARYHSCSPGYKTERSLVWSRLGTCQALAHWCLVCVGRQAAARDDEDVVFACRAEAALWREKFVWK